MMGLKILFFPVLTLKCIETYQVKLSTVLWLHQAPYLIVILEMNLYPNGVFIEICHWNLQKVVPSICSRSFGIYSE